MIFPKIENVKYIKALVGDESYPGPDITDGVIASTVANGGNLNCNGSPDHLPCVIVNRQYKVIGNRYMDVERIKPSANNDFCIVTLKINKLYKIHIKNISPLCLPANPSNEFEGRTGTVHGFGYKENFPTLGKERNNAKRMISRLKESKNFDFYSTRNCFKKFGSLALKSMKNGELVWLEL